MTLLVWLVLCYDTAANLRIMRHAKDTTISACLSQCNRLSPRGTFGIITPVSFEQYNGTNPKLGLRSDIPIWFGLLANEKMIWNRYTKEQTVHSLAQIPHDYLPRGLGNLENVVLLHLGEKFERPVFYHNTFIVVNSQREHARCVCKRGESRRQSRLEH